MSKKYLKSLGASNVKLLGNIKFSQLENEQNTLNKRIESYFKDNNLDKQANWLMVFKSITFLLLFAGIYLLIFYVDFTPVQLLPLVVLFGIAQVLLAFNIAHDASHNAYSKNEISKSNGFW